MSVCSFDDFKKIELKIGKIVNAERVENSEKLLKLLVDVGDKNEKGEPENRQILAGIGKAYDSGSLAGKEIVIVANLEPKTLMGFESQGMLLATSDDDGVVLLRPDRDVLPGAVIK